ncbi:MAG: alpha/beta fold hydrolase [Bacteroidales bacterium]|nr:alpha/beta fold hydrolase [Bacteroidales bacterium]MBN2758385.1 alpha/beta fold hydrolase [Bacteroidales bacterium]
MNLFFQKFGKGIPIVIVHGLFGSSDNWLNIAKELSNNFEVYIIDQRNHGKSPHNEEFNYDILVSDLLEFMDNQNLISVILIGHSLGGKTVMHFAKSYPKRIIDLIVIDIAPKSYLFSLSEKSERINHKKIIESLMAVNLQGIEKRKDIEEKLSENIKEIRLRQFLLKNIRRKADNSFYWTLNINSIYNNLEKLMEGVNYKDFDNMKISIPTMFVRGADSDYILNQDIEKIKTIFIESNIVTIDDAGHWLHAEQPKKLIKIITDFILK